MIRILLTILVTTLALARPPTTRPSIASAPATSPTTQPAMSVEAHFSPDEEIAITVVKLIDGAQKSVNIAAFSFTHPDIADAIIRAHRRGVVIGFVMDYTQSRLKTCRASELIDAGIEVHTRHRRGFQHNKYIVIDESILLTGSYNFTKSADARNTENLLVIRNAPDLVKAFLADYAEIAAGTLQKR